MPSPSPRSGSTTPGTAHTRVLAIIISGSTGDAHVLPGRLIAMTIGSTD